MKRFIYIFLSIMAIFTVSGCGKKFSYDSLTDVVYENILSQVDSEYIVVVYQTNCDNCEKLLGTVEKYYKYQEKNNSMPIYSINANLAINKSMLLTQGETYPDMDNTSNYKNIKVKSTPAMFIIKNGSVVKIISDYSTVRPVTDGKEYLNKLMEK